MTKPLLTGLDADLQEALAECGRIIEEMPWDERRERVDQFLTKNGILDGLTGYTRDFVIGVMINVHAHRLAYEAWG